MLLSALVRDSLRERNPCALLVAVNQVHEFRENFAQTGRIRIRGNSGEVAHRLGGYPIEISQSLGSIRSRKPYRVTAERCVLDVSPDRGYRPTRLRAVTTAHTMSEPLLSEVGPHCSGGTHHLVGRCNAELPEGLSRHLEFDSQHCLGLVELASPDLRPILAIARSDLASLVVQTGADGARSASTKLQAGK